MTRFNPTRRERIRANLCVAFIALLILAAGWLDADAHHSELLGDQESCELTGLGNCDSPIEHGVQWDDVNDGTLNNPNEDHDNLWIFNVDEQYLNVKLSDLCWDGGDCNPNGADEIHYLLPMNRKAGTASQPSYLTVEFDQGTSWLSQCTNTAFPYAYTLMSTTGSAWVDHLRSKTGCTINHQTFANRIDVEADGVVNLYGGVTSLLAISCVTCDPGTGTPTVNTKVGGGVAALITKLALCDGVMHMYLPTQVNEVVDSCASYDVDVYCHLEDEWKCGNALCEDDEETCEAENLLGGLLQ